MRLFRLFSVFSVVKRTDQLINQRLSRPHPWGIFDGAIWGGVSPKNPPRTKRCILPCHNPTHKETHMTKSGQSASDRSERAYTDLRCQVSSQLNPVRSTPTQPTHSFRFDIICMGIPGSIGLRHHNPILYTYLIRP